MTPVEIIAISMNCNIINNYIMLTLMVFILFDSKNDDRAIEN